jgi:hypothetical protein
MTIASRGEVAVAVASRVGALRDTGRCALSRDTQPAAKYRRRSIAQRRERMLEATEDRLHLPAFPAQSPRVQ